VLGYELLVLLEEFIRLELSKFNFCVLEEFKSEEFAKELMSERPLDELDEPSDVLRVSFVPFNRLFSEHTGIGFDDFGT
jgi:hypothetical protein